MQGQLCPQQAAASQAAPDLLKKADCPSFQDEVVGSPGPVLSSPGPQEGQRLSGTWEEGDWRGSAVLVEGQWRSPDDPLLPHVF